MGYNHNIHHGGRLFHVQTEDSGLAHPHIITHLFHGGTIIATKKTSYADILTSDRRDEVVREIMREQHRAMLLDLREGRLDTVLRAFGLEPIASAPAGGGASMPQAPAKPGAASLSLSARPLLPPTSSTRATGAQAAAGRTGPAAPSRPGPAQSRSTGTGGYPLAPADRHLPLPPRSDHSEAPAASPGRATPGDRLRPGAPAAPSTPSRAAAPPGHSPRPEHPAEDTPRQSPRGGHPAWSTPPGLRLRGGPGRPSHGAVLRGDPGRPPHGAARRGDPGQAPPREPGPVGSPEAGWARAAPAAAAPAAGTPAPGAPAAPSAPVPPAHEEGTRGLDDVILDYLASRAARAEPKQ